jgi:outer membrane protein
LRRAAYTIVSMLALTLAAPALAADFGSPPPPRPAASPWDGVDVLIDLGGGVSVLPKFEGSKSYEASPWPFGQARFLVNPFTGERSSPDWFDDRGFSFTPAFRYLGDRKGGRDFNLPGLGDIKTGIELGGRVGYRFPNIEVFVEGRQGISGHSGFLADLGVDILMRPTARTELTFGPRVSFATSDYMQKYFGVTAEQSAATGLAQYNVGGGLRSAGVAATGAYWLTDRWALRGQAAWSRLLGDIPDSPIIAAAGDVNQFSVQLGLSYRFGYTWPGTFK